MKSTKYTQQTGALGLQQQNYCVVRLKLATSTACVKSKVMRKIRHLDLVRTKTTLSSFLQNFIALPDDWMHFLEKPCHLVSRRFSFVAGFSRTVFIEYLIVKTDKKWLLRRRFMTKFISNDHQVRFMFYYILKGVWYI